MFRFTHAKDQNFTSSMNTRNMNRGGEVPQNVGRTILIGGTAVAAGLLGFYYSMLAYKKREQAAGNNPYHEQITGHLSRKTDPLATPTDLSTLRPLSGPNHSFSSTPPAFPGSDHHSAHQTISNFNKLHGRGASGTKSISGAQYNAKGQQSLGAGSSSGQVLSNADLVDSHTLGNENVMLDRAAGDEPVGTDGSRGALGTGEKPLDKKSRDALRYMVPPPQRGRNDGSGKAYTKSPDYAKNYNKTLHGKVRGFTHLGQSARMEKESAEAAASLSQGVPLTPKLV